MIKELRTLEEMLGEKHYDTKLMNKFFHNRAFNITVGQTTFKVYCCFADYIDYKRSYEITAIDREYDFQKPDFKFYRWPLGDIKKIEYPDRLLTAGEMEVFTSNLLNQ